MWWYDSRLFVLELDRGVGLQLGMQLGMQLSMQLVCDQFGNTRRRAARESQAEPYI